MKISAHHYFSRLRQGTEQREHLILRKQICDGAVDWRGNSGRVLTDWNRPCDGKFTPHEKMGRLWFPMPTLSRSSVTVPERASKAELYELVKQTKTKTRFTCVE